MTSYQSLGVGRLYRVPDVKETHIPVAGEFVKSRYHITVLANNEHLGVGIFEGAF